MSGIGDTVLFESLRQPRRVVFLVWAHEPGTTNRKFISVHATEESAEDYVEALNKLEPELTHMVDQEWLIGEHLDLR